MNISILGAGAWGTALAIALADRQSVLLWGREPQAMADLAARRENARYLPGIALPPALQLSSDLAHAVAHAQGGLLILATSFSGLRPMLRSLKGQPLPNLSWL